MGDVFDRWRLNQGYNLYDDQTQMAAIASWVRVLDRDGVPAEQYNELYERVLKTRALAIQSGRDLPRMGAELLLAEWLGENGLAKQLREQAKIGADKQLEMGGEPCPDDIREKLEKFGIKLEGK